jgi:hypothetical protein
MEHSNEYAQYTYRHRRSRGDGRPPEDCKCGGAGWILSALDVFDECPDHYDGQKHPEDYDY